MPPSKVAVAEQAVGVVDRDVLDDDTVDQHARDVADEDDPLGAEPDCERGGRLVGVDVERPLRERRDHRDPACRECLLDSGGRGRDRVADEPERVDLGRPEPDRVAEQRRAPGARSPRRPRALTAASESRTTSSTSAVVDAAPGDERGDDPASLHLRGDLRPGAVHDDDLVALRTQCERLRRRCRRDPAAELEHDPAHVVYSALIRT